MDDVGIGKDAIKKLVILAEDGRELLAIHMDGTVEGEIEDASEAASRFVAYVREAMNVEWEYGWAGDSRAQTFFDTQEEAEEYMGDPKQFKRRKAGAWEEVE